MKNEKDFSAIITVIKTIEYRYKNYKTILVSEWEIKSIVSLLKINFWTEKHTNKVLQHFFNSHKLLNKKNSNHLYWGLNSLSPHCKLNILAQYFN